METNPTRWTRTPVIAFAVLALTILFSRNAHAQGVIANGGNGDGAVAVAGETDTWTFSAATGDSIVVRIGQVTDNNGNFEPQIRLYDPSNTLLGTSAGDLAAEVAVTAGSTGTFTVLVSDGNLAHAGDSTNDTGSYRLHLAKSPGAFVVPAGDEGGNLINGGSQDGTIDVGDLDVWSFTASSGDGILVRVG
jgi:hypothetical protein